MRAILVDDEQNALLVLKTALEEIGNVDIVGSYQNVMCFLDEVSEKYPDVVFIDIEMPILNGFQVLEKLVEKDCSPNIVFVTAYAQYALEAFEFKALDYLLKPVNKERLKKTLTRVKEHNKIISDGKLDIECFKYFFVSIGGEEFHKHWRTKKTEELFAYLLCNRGNFVRKERIAEDLWPEYKPEKSVSLFYTTQYYLKKQLDALGFTKLLQIEYGKIKMNTDFIRCDMWAFEELIKNNDDIEKLEKAITLYKGPLFENCAYSWILEIQQQYEVDFENTLNQVIQLYVQSGREDKEKYYKKKLEIHFTP